MEKLQARCRRGAVLAVLVGAVGISGTAPALAAPTPAPASVTAQRLVPAAPCTSTTSRTNTTIPNAQASSCTPRKVCQPGRWVKKHPWSKKKTVWKPGPCYWLRY
ncbi:MAG: hypothetical protein JNM77_01570 [Pseudonocardia sp.]|nr:hypothetical protein [Pseudonocardia sp.]